MSAKYKTYTQAHRVLVSGCHECPYSVNQEGLLVEHRKNNGARFVCYAYQPASAIKTPRDAVIAEETDCLFFYEVHASAIKTPRDAVIVPDEKAFPSVDEYIKSQAIPEFCPLEDYAEIK